MKINAQHYFGQKYADPKIKIQDTKYQAQPVENIVAQKKMSC